MGKANELHTSMIFRYCYPYAIYADKDKNAIAFINRKYYFMCVFEDTKPVFWFQLDPLEFNRLYTKLSGELYSQEREERFTEFYLYDDASAPMLGGMHSDNYKRLLGRLLSLLNKEHLTARLSKRDAGFDFGKRQDGVFFEEKSEEKILNLYDVAIEEADKIRNGMV